MARGIISLDIDGTLVRQHEEMSKAICQQLSDLHDQGCILLFATGRTVAWAMKYLTLFQKPFYLAAFNGAILLKMPEKKIIRQKLLSLKDMEHLFPLIQQHGAIIYEALLQERIWCTKGLFSQTILSHIQQRVLKHKERFEEISSFSEIPPTSFASSRMFFFPDSAAFEVSAYLQKNTPFHAPPMKDSIRPEVGIIQVTAKDASKGSALAYLMDLYQLPSIAAGDDCNDLDMLQEATISIAMHEAPQQLRSIATFVAPPFEQDCIIPLLQKAVLSL